MWATLADIGHVQRKTQFSYFRRFRDNVPITFCTRIVQSRKSQNGWTHKHQIHRNRWANKNRIYIVWSAITSSPSAVSRKQSPMGCKTQQHAHRPGRTGKEKKTAERLSFRINIFVADLNGRQFFSGPKK